MALIWMSDGGSPLFAQTRIGMGGRRFRCLKLRSMCVDAEQRLAALLARDAWARAEWARDHKLRNDPRVTPLGQFLRKSSLDELPQLFNVLKGEMSLVGPRPIVEAEVPRYGRWFAHYASVRPGADGTLAGVGAEPDHLPPARRGRRPLRAPQVPDAQPQDYLGHGARDHLRARLVLACPPWLSPKPPRQVQVAPAAPGPSAPPEAQEPFYEDQVPTPGWWR